MSENKNRFTIVGDGTNLSRKAHLKNMYTRIHLYTLCFIYDCCNLNDI